MHYNSLRSQRGNIAIYVAVMIVATLMLLQAALSVSLAAFSSASAWDVRRQRGVEVRAVASATKEAILSVAETAAVTSVNALTTEIDSRIAGITSGTSGIVITESASNAAIALPANPQWPSAIPVAASTPNYSSIAGVGRNLQALISAGRVADLGSRSFFFTQTNASINGEVPVYQVNARFFSVPVTNFTWIAYGSPSSPGGVVASPPPSPIFSKGVGFTSPLVHSYSGETGTFPDMFGGTGTALPYYYRDLVSLTWNAFEYWTSLTYQNSLLAAAGTTNTFDFTNPTNLPSGVTWDGSKATLDLAVTTAQLVVFVDSVGGSTLRISGSAATGAPVVVAVRNYSSTRSIIEVANNNSRTALIYAANSTITPLSAGITFRGGVLLHLNSDVSSGLGVSGFVAYPQSFASVPPLTAYPDAQAKLDLEDLVPRVLLVSTRGILP